jgi:hypothetical protein
MTALLLATDEIHAQSVSVKHFFAIRTGFFHNLILNIKTLKVWQ